MLRITARVYYHAPHRMWVASITVLRPVRIFQAHEPDVGDAMAAATMMARASGYDTSSLEWVDITHAGETPPTGDAMPTLTASAWDILLRAAEQGSGPRDYCSVPWSPSAEADVEALVTAGLLLHLASSPSFPGMNFRATEAGIRAAEAERSRREATDE